MLALIDSPRCVCVSEKDLLKWDRLRFLHQRIFIRSKTQHSEKKKSFAQQKTEIMNAVIVLLIKNIKIHFIKRDFININQLYYHI